MDGVEFYKLAQSLSASSDPAELRSSISRAYYGAYHRASEMLRSIGVALPSGPECHKKVRWCLDYSGDADVAAASAKLSSLRTTRNDADYELDNPSLEKRPTVLRNLKIADEIIECMNLCFTGGPKQDVRIAIREYARTVGMLVT